MSSPEAIKANADLLERMVNDFDRVFNGETKVLTGRRPPNPSTHPDARMNLRLNDIAQFYDPPRQPLTEVPPLVIKRTHKSQAETEQEPKA